MTISEHASEWMGFPIKAFDPEKAPKDFTKTIYRLSLEWDDESKMEDLIATFLSLPGASEAPGLVIGSLGEDNQESIEPVVEALVAAREQLPNLRGLFLLDVVMEENEISWIQQTQLRPLLNAYPHLEHLRIRGGMGLQIGRGLHQYLKSLIIETGGLPSEVLDDIANSDFPALEHLELWLGTDSYGWDGAIENIRPVYNQNPFPKLRHLGLRNCEIADQVAMEIVKSPILSQLEALDLSLGTLGDQGAQALLDSPAILKLKKLDLHHNYISEALRQKLDKLPIDEIDTDIDGADEDADDDERYVAVSE